jgi:hypothetical protein
MKRPIEIKVLGKHVRLTVGQTLMHSEEYADAAKARRAAKSLAASICERPVRLSYLLRGEWVHERVRDGHTGFFDPTFEGSGR